MKNSLLVYLLFFSLTVFSQKEYQKSYYKNGVLKKEGWLENNVKENYWFFYYPNGKVKEQGHFKNGLKEQYWLFFYDNGKAKKEGHYLSGKQNKWWVYHNKKGEVIYKCQLVDNLRNGYCLLYKDKKIIKASKFVDDKKIKEWNDYSSFKKENNLNDLK